MDDGFDSGLRKCGYTFPGLCEEITPRSRLHYGYRLAIYSAYISIPMSDHSSFATNTLFDFHVYINILNVPLPRGTYSSRPPLPVSVDYKFEIPQRVDFARCTRTRASILAAFDWLSQSKSALAHTLT